MKILRMLLLMFSFAFVNPVFAEEPTPPAQSKVLAAARKPQTLDLKKVFTTSPFIYSILLLMSSSAVAVWLYTIATFRPKNLLSKSFVDELAGLLGEENYSGALEACRKSPGLLSSIVSSGLQARKFGPQVVIETMKSEGKRSATPFWQRLSLLNDIVIVAPMLGLLGTVIGMFYAFYDINRSIESINAFFDGLGIAIGTTVAGLLVSILSMGLAATLKYRLIKNLSLVETEAVRLSTQIGSAGKF